MEKLTDKVTEISMERTMCYGPCPVYKVIFRNDGTAYYDGKNNVERLGPYAGEIDTTEFNRLIELMDKLGFLSLNESYSIPVANQANVITTVLYDDKVKKVSNYGDTGPVEIWSIEKVIDGMIQDIYWEKEE
jgi:hypothetical protein